MAPAYWPAASTTSAVRSKFRVIHEEENAGVVQRRQIPLGDYANQSIACLVLGLFCGVAFVVGLITGYLAYRDLPRKRLQATVGMVLNSIGIGLWILLLAARFLQ